MVPPMLFEGVFRRSRGATGWLSDWRLSGWSLSGLSESSRVDAQQGSNRKHSSNQGAHGILRVPTPPSPISTVKED
jgi:hypothetical protein